MKTPTLGELERLAKKASVELIEGDPRGRYARCWIIRRKGENVGIAAVKSVRASIRSLCRFNLKAYLIGILILKERGEWDD